MDLSKRDLAKDIYESLIGIVLFFVGLCVTTFQTVLIAFKLMAHGGMIDWYNWNLFWTLSPVIFSVGLVLVIMWLYVLFVMCYECICGVKWCVWKKRNKQAR